MVDKLDNGVDVFLLVHLVRPDYLVQQTFN